MSALDSWAGLGGGDTEPLVSPEVVARMHADQTRILVLLGELRAELSTTGSPAVVSLCEALVGAFLEHKDLVDAMVEAVTEDRLSVPIRHRV